MMHSVERRDIVLVVDDSPETLSLLTDALEAAGATVHEYDGSEISIPGGGGPTCLTRPIRRE